MSVNSRRLAPLSPCVTPSDGPVRRVESSPSRTLASRGPVRRFAMLSGACVARSSRITWAPALLLGCLALALPLAAQEKEPAGRDGLFITVPDPLTDQAVVEIKRKLQAA